MESRPLKSSASCWSWISWRRAGTFASKPCEALVLVEVGGERDGPVGQGVHGGAGPVVLVHVHRQLGLNAVVVEVDGRGGVGDRPHPNVMARLEEHPAGNPRPRRRLEPLGDVHAVERAVVRVEVD
jgi:hypothetical protein